MIKTRGKGQVLVFEHVFEYVFRGTKKIKFIRLSAVLHRMVLEPLRPGFVSRISCEEFDALFRALKVQELNIFTLDNISLKASQF